MSDYILERDEELYKQQSQFSVIRPKMVRHKMLEKILYINCCLHKDLGPQRSSPNQESGQT